MTVTDTINYKLFYAVHLYGVLMELDTLSHSYLTLVLMVVGLLGLAKIIIWHIDGYHKLILWRLKLLKLPCSFIVTPESFDCGIQFKCKCNTSTSTHMYFMFLVIQMGLM